MSMWGLEARVEGRQELGDSGKDLSSEVEAANITGNITEEALMASSRLGECSE